MLTKRDSYFCEKYGKAADTKRVSVVLFVLTKGMFQADLNDDGRLCFMEFLFLITDHFDSIDIESELKTAFQV